MKIIPVIGFKYFSNSYLIASDGKCAIVDPGQQTEIYIKAIEDNALTPSMIILTHAHFDHIFSVDELRKRYGIPLYVHEKEQDFLTDGEKNAYSLFFPRNLSLGVPEKTYKDGDKLKIGSEELLVIHTPGHTCGSSCFMTENALITGDTIFSEAVGRTDLYSGDREAQIKSLAKLRLIPNGHSITIYPGHGGTAILADALDNVLY